MILRDNQGMRVTYREIVIGELVRRDGDICNICKKHIATIDEVETDHIIPLRLKGSNNFANLQLVHKSCHRQKDRKLRSALNIPVPPKKVSQVKNNIAPWKREAQKNIRTKIEAMLSQKMSIVAIAKELKISRPTVYDYLARPDLS